VRARATFLIGLCGVSLVCAVAASAKTLPGFRSPSRNISCLYVPPARDDTGHRLPSQILCSIRHADYAARLQRHCIGPTGGGVDWHGWRLAPTGKGQIVCSGGILYSPGTDHPRYVTLPYGKSWRRGVFICTSRVTGVTCRSRTRHGLFISRQSWRVW
jgi:Family of unknown function (DUF6636)